MRAREEIARGWLERIAHGYSGETARFILKEHDPFRNPVGHEFREAVDVLTGELLDGMNEDRVARALDPVMKIRAVQDFAPARAVAFIFDLKDAVGDHDPSLCRRIDSMVLIAFDLYMKWREKTYEVRLNEARRQLGRAFPALGGPDE